MTALPEGRTGRALAVMLLVAVLAVGWFGVAAPLLAWHAEREEDLAHRRAVADRMTALIAGLPELRRAAAGAAGTAPRLLEGATDALAGAELQATLQAMAARHAVTLASVEMLPADPVGGYRRIGLRVAASATWPALIGLLQAIGAAETDMLVDGLGLRAAPATLTRQAANELPIEAGFALLAFRAEGGR